MLRIDDIVELHMRRLDALRSKALNMVDYWESVVTFRETQPTETNPILVACNRLLLFCVLWWYFEPIIVAVDVRCAIFQDGMHATTNNNC